MLAACHFPSWWFKYVQYLYCCPVTQSLWLKFSLNAEASLELFAWDHISWQGGCALWVWTKLISRLCMNARLFAVVHSAWWQEGVGVWASQAMLWTLNSPQGSPLWVRAVLKAFHQPPSHQLLPRHWSQTSWFLSYTSPQSLLSSPGFSEWPFQPPFPSNSPTTFTSVGGNNSNTDTEVLTPLDEVRAGVLVPDLRAVTTLPGRSTPCPHCCVCARPCSQQAPSHVLPVVLGSRQVTVVTSSVWRDSRTLEKALFFCVWRM